MTVQKISFPFRPKTKVENLIIGHFNLIHKGHLTLFKNLKNFSFLIFENNPSKSIVLYTLEERINNLKLYSPKSIYVFNIIENNMESTEFIDKVLKVINPKKIIVGKDFYFGKDRKGDVKTLANFFEVVSLDKFNNISTSKIYELLKDGKIEVANKLLDFYFYYSGKVVHGKKIASKSFFPTANVVDEKQAEIKNGSYVSLTEIDNKLYKSISFLGIPKSFEQNIKYIETYIFDFNENIYGKHIKVSLLKFIRENQKFNTIDELITNINNDLKEAKKFHGVS